MIPLLVIVGPTAVGKTAISLRVAAELQGEIISADSMQIYRSLDIGTAKPTLGERKLVPHHLVDVMDPAVDYNVSQFQKDAVEAISAVAAKKKLPILVGGTGLYVNAVIFGYSFTEAEISPRLRAHLTEEAKSKGTDSLYQRLSELDPVSAAKIHPNDLRRIIRALEVFSLTGKPIYEQVASTAVQKTRYKTLIIGINRPREDLYRRIEDRVDQMMAAGLLEEVKSLLSRGYSPHLKSLQGLGYRHVLPYLEGEVSLEEAVNLLKRDTRRFAKRQLTWFRKNKGIIWFTLENDSVEEEDEVVKNICNLAAGELCPVLE
jgi:tRNA dimethylallyltransferase